MTQLFGILLFFLAVTTSDVGSTSCEPGENVCSKCYDVLVNEIIESDKNRFNLQRAFFPPDTSYPVFVTVIYYFTRNMSGNGSTDYSLTSPNQTWFWTQSTFYLFQPIRSLQYTSLLFSDSEFREATVFLYLQPDCMYADLNMTKLLTQRLKLLAMQQKILSPITDSYSAKGENLITLEMFHSGENTAVVLGQHFTNYGFAFQIVFPVIVMFFLCLLSHHLVENDSKGFFKQVRNALDSPNKNTKREDSKTQVERPNENANREGVNMQVEPPNKNGKQKDDNIHDMDSIAVSTRNMYIVILVICSVSFVVYVIVLDIVAITYRNTKVFAEIFFKPTQNESQYSNVLVAFKLEYSIPFLMFVYDFLIFAVMVVGMICKRCGVRKGKWYHIGIAPMSCIVVHSYHILIGFIQTPHHAASILIFYAVTVLIFYVTFKAAYYNLFQLFQRLTSNEESCVRICNCNNCLCICPCICFVLLFWPCLILLPFCRSLFSLWTDDTCKICWNWSCCTHQKCCPAYKLPHPVVLTIMSLISFFLSCFMVFVVGLFILIPINMAIDDAPARLFSINQTVLVLIGAAITYKLYRNHAGAHNIIEQLVKANTEYLATNGISGQLVAWKDLDKVDKEIEVGKFIIAALHTMSAPALQQQGSQPPAPALQQQGSQPPAPALQQHARSASCPSTI